jgi:outer membrane receptor protein involved in Fe transport
VDRAQGPFVRFLIAVSLVTTGFGQVDIAGRVTGVVEDASGAAIIGATVKLQGSSLMAPRSTTTQSDGSYLFAFVPIGTYVIMVEAQGFKSSAQKDIQISSGFVATVTTRLAVESSREVVDVPAIGPVVDTKSVATSTTFDDSLLQSIPSGRDVWSTIAQAPGTTMNDFDVGGNQSFQQAIMQVHGSMPGEQVYSFNGLRMNWPGSTGGYTAYYIDSESLQELQVITDSAPAEVSAGGVYMNLVTKSGSNQIHGTAAAYYTTAALREQVTEPIYNGSPVKAGSPMNMLLDTVANAGGPIIQDRWWIFGGYRRYDINESILAIDQPPSEGGGPISDINHVSNTILRSDWQLNNRNRVNFQWLYNDHNRFFRRDTNFQFVDAQASWLQISPSYLLQSQWTSQLTNNLLVDVRGGYMHLLFPLGYQRTVTPNDINVQDLGFSTETGAAPYVYLNPAETARIAATASYYRAALLAGGHNFKFGYEAGRSKNGNFYDVNHDLISQFNAGVPLDVIIYNTPVQEEAIFHDSAFFVQDSWSLTPRLTLNLGLRFDHFRTFNPGQSSPDTGRYVSLFPARTFPQSSDLADWNNWAPRLGAAYDLTGKGRSVLRAAYSRFYRVEGTELADAVNANGLSGQTYKWNGATVDGIPDRSEFLHPANFLGSFGGIVTHIDPGLKDPYSDELSVGWEQQLYRNLRVGLTYYYRTYKNLIAQRNSAIPPADYTPITAIGGVPITNPLNGQPMTLYNVIPAKVGAADYLVTNIAELNDNAYHGLEFLATKRLSDHWQMLAGFTIQRDKGVYSAAYLNGSITDDFNDPNKDINRRNSYLNYDSTYVLKVAATYEFPYSISGSLNFQHYTGYPFQPMNVFTGLNQNSETVILAPAGETRLPSVNLLNLRISRPTKLGESGFTLEPIADLLNLTNSNTVVAESNFIGSLRQPSDVLHPFVAKFGLRLTF